MTEQGPAARAAAWLAQYERNRAAASAWIDRSWLPSWWPQAASTCDALSAPDSVEALMRTLSVPAPDMELVFDCAERQQGTSPDCRGSGKAAMPALALTWLSVPEQLRMLRLRAFVFRRGEVRRVVDLERRARLAAWLGDQGGAQLRWLQGLEGAPEMSVLTRMYGAPHLDALDATALAWEGYCLFQRDGVLRAGDATAQLLRLGLPRALDTPAWLARCPRDTDADGSERVLRRLPILFPEHAWSFGCEIPPSN
ncbi:type III secretion protein HrpB4 [Trinickia sp.]|uniref:type III secretion protein HrpB4 n=1 Tax=Trinickia sp. TaxID=2571163 RepID=UPI003F816F33